MNKSHTIMITLIVILVAVLAVALTGTAQDTVTTRWEYETLYIDTSEFPATYFGSNKDNAELIESIIEECFDDCYLDIFMSTLGDEGWELVSTNITEAGLILAWFKRPLE